MTLPADSSQPRLAIGCRWSPNREDGILLFPEGALKLQGTGREVLERCDGQNTLGQIVDDLQKHYTNSDRARIRDDVAKFLEALHLKRIVDY